MFSFQNILVVSKYYSRITVKRLAELLCLSIQVPPPPPPFSFYICVCLCSCVAHMLLLAHTNLIFVFGNCFHGVIMPDFCPLSCELAQISTNVFHFKYLDLIRHG
jgi:hypothetical protein